MYEVLWEGDSGARDTVPGFYCIFASVVGLQIFAPETKKFATWLMLR